MAHIEMIYCKIKDLNMKNHLKDSQTLKCTNKDHFSVVYNKDHTTAVATLTESLEMTKKPSRFYLELTLEGVFLIEDVKNKSQREDTHRKCYSDMFPIAAEIIKYLTSNSGVREGVSIQERLLKQVNFGPEAKMKNENIINFPC